MSRFPIDSGPTGGTVTFQGNVGGISNVWQAADSSLTRPSNATVYASGNAIGSSSSTVFRFGSFFRQPGSSGLLTGSRLVASLTGIGTANMGAITAHVFNVTPTGAPNADQGTFESLLADDTSKLGTISFSSWNIGGTGSNLIESYGALVLQPMPIMAASAAQELYVVLEATAAFTPAASQVMQLYLSGVLD